MGGRGSFSGLTDAINSVLGEDKKGKAKEISVSQFGTLEETENKIRGRHKEVLAVFDQEGKAIKAYQGNSDSVAFPVEEAKKWKGLTVTHNHPKGAEEFGGTLSIADINNALQFEFGSIRAVSNGQGEKNYILKAGKNADPIGFSKRIQEDISYLREKMIKESEQVAKDYKNKKYNNYGHALHVARQKSVGVLNSYYREIAEQYGYIYRTQK